VKETYRLTVTAASDRTAAKRPTYAETAKAERRGDREPVRDTLRRSVRTAGSSSLGQFLDRLRGDGVLVRERFSERIPGQITGYSVALPGRSDPGGRPIYFGGGKLAADLTLLKLLRRWDLPVSLGSAAASGGGGAPAQRSEPVTDATFVPAEGTGIPGERVGEERHRLTVAEQARIWQQATLAAATATEQVTAAAGEYDLAARELWGPVPEASDAGKGLRAARCCSRPRGSSTGREQAAPSPACTARGPVRCGDQASGDPGAGRSSRRPGVADVEDGRRRQGPTPGAAARPTARTRR